MTITEQLLQQHDGWLRNLAARLVDDGTADDLAQEVWHAVAKRPPADGKHWRAWLATVARRLAGKQRRGAFRRARREELSVRLEPDRGEYDPELLAERAEQRQRVAAMVLALDPLFREVILLRYFEGLEPSEIAARTGIPSATVRTRLHRAHEKLRLLISVQEGESWRPWLAALVVPLPRLRGAPMSVSGIGSVIAVCAALLALSVWWLILSPPLSESKTVSNDPRDVSREDAVESKPEREIIAPDPEADASPEPHARARVLRGVVTDHLGARIPNAPIFLDPSDTDLASRIVAQSDQNGAFTIRAADMEWCQDGRLLLEGDWQTVQYWRGGLWQEMSDDALIIAAPRVTLRGRLVDGSGAPIGGAHIWPYLNFLVGYPESHAGTEHQSFRGPPRIDVDEEGRYSIENVPACPGFSMRVSARGFEEVFLIPADFSGGTELETVMQPRAQSGAKVWPPRSHRQHIAGSLHDPLGNPISAGGCVLVGGSMVAKTKSDGAFELWHESDEAFFEWIAGAPGFAPRRGRIVVARNEPEPRLDIVLQRQGPQLSGTVVDTRGEPQLGLIVCIADPLPLASSSAVSGNLMAGQPGANAKKRYGVNDQVGALGHFSIGPVLERPHRLRVIDPAESWAMTFEGAWPGDHRLEVPDDRRARPFRGRVMSSDGKPVAGIRVLATVETYHWQTKSSSLTAFIPGSPEAVTDKDGRFVFEAAPSCAFELDLVGVGFDDFEQMWRPGEPREVNLVLPSLRRVRFDIPDLYKLVSMQFGQRFSGVAFFDAHGVELPCKKAWRGKRFDSASRPGLAQGRSEVIAVSERAVIARILNKDGSVWREESVFLRKGRVQVLTMPK